MQDFCHRQKSVDKKSLTLFSEPQRMEEVAFDNDRDKNCRLNDADELDIKN